jgi:hypothetical protein
MAARLDPLAEYLQEKAKADAEAKKERERLEAVAAMKAGIAYSREMAAEICDLIATGEVLRDICQREHTPTLKIVRRWLKDRPEFAQAFAEAERDRLFAWEDEMIVAARDDSNDHTLKDDGHSWVKVPNSAAVSRSKLQCETIARRLRAEWPEKYGDSVTLKPATPDFGEQLKTIPLGELERMADNARQLERDDEAHAVLEAKEALKRLNRDRSKRGEPPLPLADYLARQ